MMELLDVRIDSIAAGGDGVGRHEGMVVFVPRTAPGDVVRVRAERHARLMRGRIVELLQASPLRTDPPCVHYVRDDCGGCQLQHLQYDAQRQAKTVIVHDAMARIARSPVDAPPVAASPRDWRYRTKLTLAIRPADGDWVAGLHRYDPPNEVFALADCPITDERVMDHWRSVLAMRHLFPRARALRGAVRLVGSGEAFAFTLEGGGSWPQATLLFEKIPAMQELWWHPQGRRRQRMAARGVHAGASFAQVNPAVASQVRDHVMALVAEHRPGTIVDAYAGTGDTAEMLAATGARVTTIEIDRDAARVCAERLREPSRSIVAAVEDALADALPAELVLLNPPRAGVADRVAAQLNAPHGVRAIVYVSCNPATLARDVARLTHWRIRSLRAFDMFPQTAHVETVCELVPAT